MVRSGIKPVSAAAPTLTGTVKTLFAPIAMAVVLVHVTVVIPPALVALQVQLAAFTPPRVIAPVGIVIPAGMMSLTVIVPLVFVPPWLETVNWNVPV